MAAFKGSRKSTPQRGGHRGDGFIGDGDVMQRRAVDKSESSREFSSQQARTKSVNLEGGATKANPMRGGFRL